MHQSYKYVRSSLDEKESLEPYGDVEYMTHGVASENAKADLHSATALKNACRRMMGDVR